MLYTQFTSPVGRSTLTFWAPQDTSLVSGFIQVVTISHHVTEFRLWEGIVDRPIMSAAPRSPTLLSGHIRVFTFAPVPCSALCCTTPAVAWQAAAFLLSCALCARCGASPDALPGSSSGSRFSKLSWHCGWESHTWSHPPSFFNLLSLVSAYCPRLPV